MATETRWGEYCGAVGLWTTCVAELGAQCVVSQASRDHIPGSFVRWLSLEEVALMELAR